MKVHEASGYLKKILLAELRRSNMFHTDLRKPELMDVYQVGNFIYVGRVYATGGRLGVAEGSYSLVPNCLVDVLIYKDQIIDLKSAELN